MFLGDDLGGIGAAAEGSRRNHGLVFRQEFSVRPLRLPAAAGRNGCPLCRKRSLDEVNGFLADGTTIRCGDLAKAVEQGFREGFDDERDLGIIRVAFGFLFVKLGLGSIGLIRCWIFIEKKRTNCCNRLPLLTKKQKPCPPFSSKHSSSSFSLCPWWRR